MSRRLYHILLHMMGALLFACTAIWGFSRIVEADVSPSSFSYSSAGREHEVSFQGVYRSSELSLRSISELTDQKKKDFVEYRMMPVTDYFFGPLTHRSMGGVKRMIELRPDWSRATEVNGAVEIPYVYRGQWLLEKSIAAQGEFDFPVPLNDRVVFTPQWKECTDSAPEHQTRDFYWYFWDPSRSGCDHQESTQYMTVRVQVGAETPNTKATFPEYERLIRQTSEGRALNMTIAFGYVEDRRSPNPDKNSNTGMSEYRRFLGSFKQQWGRQLKESPILQGEYRSASNPALVIGHRFSGDLRGVRVTVNIVTAAGIDQMDLFAKSYAHDHDGVFAWFGHSRVGSGFDAERFASLVARDPSYYSITEDYQLVYWGGCNSYSYYTLPFFEQKARMSGDGDPNGTRNLDIIANGLPSYFALNAQNASIFTGHILNWERRPSYQTIIGDIERAADRFGAYVLAIVLGDEDNA